MSLIFLIITLLITSCSFDEYTHMEGPEVSSCALEKSCIKVVFSARMRKGLTESAFSCSCDSTSEAGTFVWEGKKMYFFPMSGIKEKSLYEVEIGTRAEDTYGNSLKEAFCCTFSTGGDADKPVVQSLNISEGEVVSDLLMPIQIDFSKPVEASYLYQHFTITPAVLGNTEIKNNGKSVVFTPLEKMEWNTVYTLTIGDKKVMFSTPEKPHVNLLRIQIKDGPFLKEETIQHDVEKDAVLVLSFSGTAEGSTVKTPVTFSPPQSYTPVWNSSYTECTVTFDNPLPFETLLEISTSDARYYYLYLDGKNSVPPSVKGIKFYQDYTTGNSEDLEYGSGIIFESGDQACFEFELLVGKNSFFYPADVYSNVDIEVAMGNLSIIPKRLETVKESDNRALIRLFCSITEGTVQTPVVIRIYRTLKDSCGNTMEKDYVLRINSI